MWKPDSEKVKSFFTLDRTIYIVLFFLSLVGIGISDFSAKDGLWYWLAMVPIFGGVSIYNEWHQTRQTGDKTKNIVVRQLMHWLALALAVYLVYILQSTGRMNMENAGLVVLLALALTTFLAGVHFNWRFAIFGLVLGATAAAAAVVEQFFWIMFLLALIAGVIVIFYTKKA